MSDYSKYVTGPIKAFGSFFTSSGKHKVVETIVKYEKQEPFGFHQLPKVGKNFLRIAALSGLASICMSAYGSHVFNKKQTTAKDTKELYFTAQYYHMVHSVAMLSIPLVKRPKITGTLWLSGLVLFCGSMYYRCITGDERFRFLAPYGGFCFIAGWLTIII